MTILPIILPCVQTKTLSFIFARQAVIVYFSACSNFQDITYYAERRILMYIVQAIIFCQ